MAEDKIFRSWYVLHTRSRFENVVYELLTKKSLEAFLPKCKVKSKRRDRKIMIDVPLFPGYVFVRTDLQPVEHLNILKTVGVVRLIAFEGGPVPVPNENIESLKIMVESGMPIITGSRFRKGHRIIVIRGPFTGVTGVFVRYGKKGKVVVLIKALGQFASVQVDEEDIEILPEVFA